VISRRILGMKATGIVRKVDELGRIVIPIELRRTMGIDIKDPLEIFVDGEKIILRKYEPTCIFSGSSENLINFKGKMVSKDILDELLESFKQI
jgi:looped-hinge helix DNA binding domain, AbrB family